MQIELTPAEAEMLLNALIELHGLEDYDAVIVLPKDWRLNASTFLLYAKLIGIAQSSSEAAPGK